MDNSSELDDELRFVVKTIKELIDDMPADRIMEQIELQVEVDGILQNKPKEEALELLKNKILMLEKEFKA